MKDVMEEMKALRNRISELEMDEKHYKKILKIYGHEADRTIPSKSYMQEAVFVIFDRRLEFINDPFAELFGVTPEEACAPDFDPETLIAPESRRLIWKLYHHGCRGAFARKQIHFMGLTKNGLKIACETSILFIPYKWGLAVQGSLRSASMGRRGLHVVSNAVPAEASSYTPMRITV
jgi:PAS domain-containing protein